MERGILDSLKIRNLPAEVGWTWLLLMACSDKIHNTGYLPVAVREIAWRLRMFSPDATEQEKRQAEDRTLAKLALLKEHNLLVSQEMDGVTFYMIKNWDEHQTVQIPAEEEDQPSHRTLYMRAYRARKAAEQVPVTLPQDLLPGELQPLPLQLQGLQDESLQVAKVENSGELQAPTVFESVSDQPICNEALADDAAACNNEPQSKSKEEEIEIEGELAEYSPFEEEQITPPPSRQSVQPMPQPKPNRLPEKPAGGLQAIVEDFVGLYPGHRLKPMVAAAQIEVLYGREAPKPGLLAKQLINCGIPDLPYYMAEIRPVLVQLIESEDWRDKDGMYIPSAEKWLKSFGWLMKPKQPEAERSASLLPFFKSDIPREHLDKFFRRGPHQSQSRKAS